MTLTIFRCDKCLDTGLVRVDKLSDPQPCLWCNIGQELFWTVNKMETTIRALKDK